MKCEDKDTDAQATIDACEQFVEAAEERRKAIVELAHEVYHTEGSVEVDDSAGLSEGDDNGCYVQAWVWVGFSGTEFDKESAPEPETTMTESTVATTDGDLITMTALTENPRFPKEDWRYEVNNEDTDLGYWQWVAHQVAWEEEND